MIAINAENFPDDGFRSYISSNFDTDGDGLLSDEEVAEITSISFYYSSPESLSGIKLLTNLSGLSLVNVTIHEVDLSECASLVSFIFQGSLIDSINLSGCTNLKSLSGQGATVLSIDCSGCTGISDVGPFRRAEVGSLNFSGCTGLNEFLFKDHVNERLDVQTSINLSGCTGLRRVEITGCDLESLNLSGCSRPNTVSLMGNLVRSVDFSHCAWLRTGELEEYLYELYDITSINLSGCTSLDNLDLGALPLDSGQDVLASVDISGCTSLSGLHISSNKLSSLNARGCTQLYFIEIEGGHLSELDFSGCVNLNDIHFYNTYIESIDFSDSTKLKDAIFHSCEIKSANFSEWTGLEFVWIDECHLTEPVVLSDLTSLFEFKCEDSYVPSINISGCSGLRTCSIVDGKIQSVNISRCGILSKVQCSRSDLLSIDISGGNIEYLYCNGNKLTSLDLSKFNHLKELNCSNNNLQSLDVSMLLYLQKLNCGCNRLKTIILGNNNVIRRFSCPYNPIDYIIAGDIAIDTSDGRIIDGTYIDGLWGKYCCVDISGCPFLVEYITRTGLYSYPYDLGDYALYFPDYGQQGSYFVAGTYNIGQARYDILTFGGALFNAVISDDFYTYDGNIATFTAKAPGNDNTYRWQAKASGSDIWVDIECIDDLQTTVIQGKQIRITARKEFDRYQFRCIVSNGTLTAETDAATLYVIEKHVGWKIPYGQTSGGQSGNGQDGGTPDTETTGIADTPIKIVFDTQHRPLPIRMVLATRSGSMIRELPINHVKFKDDLGNGSEISFVVYKNRCVDEEGNIDMVFWRKIENLRLGYCPEFDMWYELQTESTDSSETMKSVTAVSLGEAELNQIKVYGIEVNTETDIAREDYRPTVLFHGNDASISLIDRLLYKAPHYKVRHVDSSIRRLQRTFQFDNKTVYECFQQIAQEIGCLFRIECRRGSKKNIIRTIDVYDLWNICLDCGERGEFTEQCDSCGSTNIQRGYGVDTSVYVDKDNLADEITFSTDVGSIKNCFRLTAGDDLMTAAIISCNPNGSQYIWYIPEYMQEDMSGSLKDKLDAYNKLYDYYQKEHTVVLSQIVPSE